MTRPTTIPLPPMACVHCGCTDDNACAGACWWVSPGVCSGCSTLGTPKQHATWPPANDGVKRKLYWSAQRALRRIAKPGDLVHFGKTNFGRDELLLVVVRRTPTQLVCSDGKRTERVMIESGFRVGSAATGAVELIPRGQVRT